MTKLSRRDVDMLMIVNKALDAGTEIGIETTSRELLLMRLGEIVGYLRSLKEIIA